MLDQDLNKTAGVVSNQQALDFIEKVQHLLNEEPQFKSAEEKQFYQP